MTNRLIMTIGIFAFASGAVMSGCSSSPSSNACTLIGCQDGFSAGVSTTDGILPSGMHRIEVLVDGVTMMCAFKVPLEMTATGGVLQPVCPSGLTVVVTPAADAQVEMINLAGTPGQVHAWQYVDDTPVLDVAVAPTYHENRPNGPACGPVCQQASASWMMTPP